jgi:hypothetical protein
LFFTPTLRLDSCLSMLSAAAEDAEIRVGMALADAALVFRERHVELPVQAVFDAPMLAHGLGEAARFVIGNYSAKKTAFPRTKRHAFFQPRETPCFAVVHVEKSDKMRKSREKRDADDFASPEKSVALKHVLQQMPVLKSGFCDCADMEFSFRPRCEIARNDSSPAQKKALGKLRSQGGRGRGFSGSDWTVHPRAIVATNRGGNIAKVTEA